MLAPTARALVEGSVPDGSEQGLYVSTQTTVSVLGLDEARLLIERGVAAGFVTRVREAWGKANRLLPGDYLDVHTRRLLLEKLSLIHI